VAQKKTRRNARLRLRASNRFKVLLCYLISFAVPLLWQWAGLWLLYPYKLANTAPPIADTVSALWPGLSGSLAAMAQDAALPLQGDPGRWIAVLQLRDRHWILFLAVCFAAAWLLSLLVQLIWRIRHSRAINAAKLCRRARRSYRLHLLIILCLNLLPALLIWLTGVQHIPGRTLWDWLVYFPAYGLNVLAAILCFRLAAPPAISGKHGFFKRL
jgi:hypothetical protein